MAYAILRAEKLKSFGEIGGSLAHTFRTRETPNADPARFLENEHGGPTDAQAIQQAIRDRLPEKYRSDAVLCIEYLVTASPDHFKRDDGRQYFEDAKVWLIERHGVENVISTHVHRDETSPHLVAYVVPRDGDKLNAKKFLGGRAILSQMQSDFAQNVGRKHHLERGIEGSKAQHQTIREYYARANQLETVQKVDFPREKEARGLIGKETDTDFAQRVARSVHDQMIGGWVKGKEVPALAKKERDQAREIARLKTVVGKLETELGPWRKAAIGLSPTDVRSLQVIAERKAMTMRIAAQHVVGWFKGVVRLGVMLIQDPKTNLQREVLSPGGQRDLDASGAARGDLVEIRGNSASIVERGHEQAQQRGRGPDRGR